jgi:hypothetical protein
LESDLNELRNENEKLKDRLIIAEMEAFGKDTDLNG